MGIKVFKIIFYFILVSIIAFFFLKDIPFFKKEKIKMTENPSSLTALVNKKYKLPKDYIPSDLEEINHEYSNEAKYLRHEAKEAFEKLSKDAKKLNYRIIAVSAYRDYNYQETLYASYVLEKGIEYADMCSAKAGHSEHQTGLAVDVEGSNFDYNKFLESKEANWMMENARLYGFILRYPKDKENITGFKFEPWHYRYVGIEVATYIYENNFTLEEYTEKLKKSE